MYYNGKVLLVKCFKNSLADKRKLKNPHRYNTVFIKFYEELSVQSHETESINLFQGSVSRELISTKIT